MMHVLRFKIISIIIVRCYDLPIDFLGAYPTIEQYTNKGWWIIYLLTGVSLPLILNYLYQQIKQVLVSKLVKND